MYRIWELIDTKTPKSIPGIILYLKWRVGCGGLYDLWKISGSYSQEMMGFVLGFILRIRLPTDAVLFQKSHYPKVIVPVSVDEKV